MRGEDATQPAEPPARPLRADARRNRDALLSAAATAFATRGVEASLEDVARTAGVGIGTLYRHFPTRDALIEAVYRREVERLPEVADELLRRLPPDQALAGWLQEFVRYIAAKRGLAEAVKAIVGLDSQLYAHAHARIRASVEKVLSAAIADGSVRADIEPADLLRAVSGICLAGSATFDDQASRLVGLLMDGLRVGAPGPTERPPHGAGGDGA